MIFGGPSGPVKYNNRWLGRKTRLSQRSSTNGMLEQFVISELRKAKIQLEFSFLWFFKKIFMKFLSRKASLYCGSF